MTITIHYYIVSRPINHLIASVPVSCSFLTPPSNLVFGHSSTMCLIVWSAPHEQRGDFSIPHLWSRLLHLPCSVLIRFSFNHIIRGRSKPGILVSGFSIRTAPLTPESLQRDFHVSDKSSAGNSRSHIGCLDLSLFWGCLVIYSYSGRFGFF